MKTILQGIGVMGLSLCLLACEKPVLKATPKEQQVALLLQASRVAEQQMGLYNPPGGGFYPHCMQGNEAKINCERLFKEMLVCIQKEPDFHQVTLEELSDPALFAALTEAYLAAFFDAVAS